VPENPHSYLRLEELGLAARLREPDKAQLHWYALAGQYCVGKEVLDVGSGTGYGLSVLFSLGAKAAIGIDPLPAGPGVAKIGTDQLHDGSFDVVTCMDVIEHVTDDKALLAELLRLAREAVFISTPIWDGEHWGSYHAREYSADELTSLLMPYRYRAWTCGDGLLEAVPVRTWPVSRFHEAWRATGVLIYKAPQMAQLPALLTTILSVSPHDLCQKLLETAVGRPLVRRVLLHTDGASELELLLTAEEDVVLLPHCHAVLTDEDGQLISLSDALAQPNHLKRLQWPWAASNGEGLEGFFAGKEAAFDACKDS